jgi:hypothetical protein
MPLLKGVNSYATLAEANEYFGLRLDVAAWTAASPEQQEQAIATATSCIDTLKFKGCVVDATQLLCWPRVVTFYNERKGLEETTGLTEIPLSLTLATLEMAHHLLNNDGLLDETGGIDKIDLDGLKFEGISLPSIFPSSVSSKLKGLLFEAPVSRTWWRAN